MPDLSAFLSRLDAAQSAHELSEIEEAYYATATEKGWPLHVLQTLEDHRHARAVELTRKSGALVG